VSDLVSFSFPPSGPTSLQDILPAFVYQQYSDDINIQALNTGFNQLAQAYQNWFNTANLPIYTGLAGATLDYVAQGLYGISRPTLPYGSVSMTGPLNTYQLNTMQLNSFITSGSVQVFTTTDDIFKRIITWFFFKGDGQQFSIPWLKRRIMRFLIGVNGTAPNIDQTYPVSISFGMSNTVVITITLTPSNGLLLFNAQIFQAAIASGALATPFNLSFSVTLVNDLGTTGLANNSGFLQVVVATGYPTSASGLAPGQVWNAGGAVYVIPGVSPNPNAPALIFGVVTAAQLLSVGGGNLPLTDPGVAGQLWNADGVVFVSAGESAASSGFTVVNAVLTLTIPRGYPITGAGLSPGAVFNLGGAVNVVPGVTPNPNAPPFFYGVVTAQVLLATGGGNLPLADPLVTNQLWNNNGVVNVSGGVIVYATQAGNAALTALEQPAQPTPVASRGTVR
jgi:hypothetical protein